MLSTLEKMRLDVDRFARLYGLENPITIKLYQKLDEAEMELDEATISRPYERAWADFYSQCEATIKNEGAFEEC